jgi:chromosome segregation ATPase
MNGDEYDRLMDEREILRQEAARAWREVDFIAKERTEHLEWRTKLANDLDECERMRDTLARTLNKRENDLMLLRTAVDAMMAPLGYHGTISARDNRVQAVMDALAHIDTAPARREG